MVCILCDAESEQETEIGHVDVREPNKGKFKFQNEILCSLCVKKFQAMDYSVEFCHKQKACH